MNPSEHHKITPRLFDFDFVSTPLDPDPNTSPRLHPELLKTSQDARDKLRAIREHERENAHGVHQRSLNRGKPGYSDEVLAFYGLSREDFEYPDL